FLAFAIPAGDVGRHRLAGQRARLDIPWDMLLLLGGGFAIARAFTSSGLSDALAGALAPALSGGTGAARELWVVLGLSIFVTFLSEVTSNTATALVMLPL